jgi:hypothetical protein
MRFDWVAYLQALLTAIASLFVSVLMPTLATLVRSMSTTKATGFAVVAGGLMERVLSPRFWATFIFVFSLFFVTARLESRLLRVVLFWIPASRNLCRGIRPLEFPSIRGDTG